MLEIRSSTPLRETWNDGIIWVMIFAVSTSTGSAAGTAGGADKTPKANKLSSFAADVQRGVFSAILSSPW